MNRSGMNRTLGIFIFSKITPFGNLGSGNLERPTSLPLALGHGDDELARLVVDARWSRRDQR